MGSREAGAVWGGRHLMTLLARRLLYYRGGAPAGCAEASEGSALVRDWREVRGPLAADGGRKGG
jgi:hypothetical protein